MPTYRVKSASNLEFEKRLSLIDEKDSSLVVRVGRYAPVGKGDTIIVNPKSPKKLSVLSQEGDGDLITISPHFSVEDEVRIAGLRFEAKISEIVTKEDVDNLDYLEQFHYKTNNLLNDPSFDSTKKKSVSQGGRRAILLLTIKQGSVWHAAGYIELHMPLMMCKPRHDLFATPFKHSKRSINWQSWNQESIKQYVNLIVRIARVVVSPEFRGLGLAKNLVETAKKYCTERWQISGRRPVFLEISAEMLKYVDFVSSVGFKLVDYTEGNIKRVVSDMQYMSRGYDVSSGIMSLQKKYLTKIQEYCAHTDKTFESVIDRLSTIVQSDDPASAMTASEWSWFRSILRMPIPYYLCGLDDDSKSYLEEHLPSGRAERPHNFSVRATQISLPSISVHSEVSIKPTQNVRMIMDAFGLRGDRIFSQLVPEITLEASSGNVILIAGSSGSGKSVLLGALDPCRSSSAKSLTFNVSGKQDYTAGWMRQLPAEDPLFDYFANRYGPERSFAALSAAGLSEALVLIKPFWMLSRGQQYRAMLADLLLRDEQVWLLDEFCADLDLLTARIVAHNFRKLVRKTQRVAVVAAANHSHYIDALRPAYVLYLKQGGDISRMGYAEYRDEFLPKAN